MPPRHVGSASVTSVVYARDFATTRSPILVAQQPAAAQGGTGQQILQGITGAAGPTATGDVFGFRLVFFCVLGLTIFSALINVYLASAAADTQRINTLIETYSTTWKLGFGAIIGLISGKAIG